LSVIIDVVIILTLCASYNKSLNDTAATDRSTDELGLMEDDWF